MREHAERAVVTAVATALPGVPIEHPNLPAPTIAPGARWMKLHHLGVRTVRATIGLNGLDRISGIVYLSCHYPLLTGNKAATADADTLATYFYAGRALSYGGQAVEIEGCDATGGKEGRDWFLQHVSIYWYAYVTRGG